MRKYHVLNPFDLSFQSNTTRIAAGTALRDAGDGYLGFEGDFMLLLDPDAVARLIGNGSIGLADRALQEAPDQPQLQAAE